MLLAVNNLLKIKNLKVHYFTENGIVKAVDDINLNIDNKEVVALVGESGCGKSTVAYSILRLLSKSARIVGGEIIFHNKNLINLSEEEIRLIRGKEISMIFQDPLTFLNPSMKIKNQISEVPIFHNEIHKKDVEEKVIELLKSVHLPSVEKVMNYYPHQLSGGMRQRVMIAIALSQEPSLLIADEPTTALDTTIQAQILELLKNIKEKFNMSILLITHDLGIVAELCDKVYIMYAGKIVEGADVYTIFKNPKHPYTIGLLNSALSIDEFKENLMVIEGSVPNLINPPSGCRFHPRCHYSMLKCKEEEPKMIRTSNGHEISCWLYG